MRGAQAPIHVIIEWYLLVHRLQSLQSPGAPSNQDDDFHYTVLASSHPATYAINPSGIFDGEDWHPLSVASCPLSQLNLPPQNPTLGRSG